VLVSTEKEQTGQQTPERARSYDSLRDTIYITHIKSTCFRIQVPSSGSYYNKGLCANLLIYIYFFIIISFITTLVVKIHKMCNIHKNI